MNNERDFGLTIKYDPDILWNAVNVDGMGTIFSGPLLLPLKDLQITLSIERGSFDLGAELRLSPELLRGAGMHEPVEFVIALGSAIEEKDARGVGQFILHSPGEVDLVLASLKSHVGFGGEVRSGVWLHTSHWGDPAYGRRALPSPESKREGFERVLARFFATLQGIIDYAYVISGIEPPPKQEIALSVNALKHVAPAVGSGVSLQQSQTLTKNEALAILAPYVLHDSGVDFSMIGGQKRAKEEIGNILLCLKHPKEFKRWGIGRLPRGVVMYGPPGNGKTELVRALARETKALLVAISVSDVLTKWFSESANKIAQIFSAAHAFGDTVFILFDEVDGLASARDGEDREMVRVTNQILVGIDGLRDRSGNVVVISTTNRLDAIDPGFLRNGRTDRLLEVPLPDAEGRREILLIHMEKARRVAERELFHDDVDLDELARKTEGLSGAGLAELILRTLGRKFVQEVTGGTTGLVSAEDLLATSRTLVKETELVNGKHNRIGF